METTLPAKTLYAATLAHVGMSQSDAQAFHKITRPQTIGDWAMGRRPVPAGAWAELVSYSKQIDDRVAAVGAAWEAAGRPMDFGGEDPAPIDVQALVRYIMAKGGGDG